MKTNPNVPISVNIDDYMKALDKTFTAVEEKMKALGITHIIEKDGDYCPLYCEPKKEE